MKRNYFYQVTIAIDQLFNTLLAGHADETISARAYRKRLLRRRWAIMRIIIDGIFFWEKNHCKEAYLSEKLRRQYPEYYRTEV